MTEYNIAGSTVKILAEVENEHNLRLSTDKLVSEFGKNFDFWYSSQGNCSAVLENSDDFLAETAAPLIKKAVKILNEQGVNSFDESLFMSKYLSEYDNDFRAVLNKMKSRISEIDNRSEAVQRYRKAKKAGRGKIINGGFGLGEALKGMSADVDIITAVKTTYSGENSNSVITADSDKAAVYNDTKKPLNEALTKCSYNILNGIRTALENEANKTCRCISDEESTQANEILESCLQKNISESLYKNQLIQALTLNPYNPKIYEMIWNDFGDETGDLRKMSLYFGTGLEHKIQSVVSKHAEDASAADCKKYSNDLNKVKSNIETEASTKNPLNDTNNSEVPSKAAEKIVQMPSFESKAKAAVKTPSADNASKETVQTLPAENKPKEASQTPSAESKPEAASKILSAESKPKAEITICPNCGKAVKQGKKFCSNCGFKIQKDTSQNPALKSASETLIVHCPNCGNAVKPGKKFCSNCGFKILGVSETTVTHCPNCGNIIKPGKKFCSRCGTKI